MFSRIFHNASNNSSSDGNEIITVVSGLPRSGTSMMMRMLEAGGLPVMTDSVRRPDESNPKGYYELEEVKHMKTGGTDWLSSCRGKAVKIVSPLLQYLPAGYEYRVVFMKRHMKEILASQREMLASQGQAADPSTDRALEEYYQLHLSQVTSRLAEMQGTKVLYLTYNEILENPGPAVSRLAQFLQPFPLNQARMLGVIESPLYRQREKMLQPVHQPKTG